MRMNTNDRAPVELAKGDATPRRALRVVIADDECMFRTSLRHLLTAPPSVIKDVYGIDVGADFDVVGEASTGEDTVSVIESTKPDLLLLDMSMPRMSGIKALRALQGCRDSMRTVILAAEISRGDLAMAIQLGVRGVVLKASPTELLFQAIASVIAGQPYLAQPLVADLMEIVRAFNAPAKDASRERPAGLTRREREVLGLVVAGYANKEIARTFSVSEETVKHHLTRMFDKVGAANRLELAMFATERGLVSDV